MISFPETQIEHHWDRYKVSVLGHFPFVRTDRLDHSRHNENFTLRQNLSSQIRQILNTCSMPEGDGFSAQTLRKSLFHLLTDWSGNGPAGQF